MTRLSPRLRCVRCAALLAGLFLATTPLPPPARGGTLTVFAASSLTEAFRDLAEIYRDRNPGEDVEFQFAGSPVLQVQIAEGADADVFASADRVQMDALESLGLVGADAIFARNRLVVVTPRRDPKVRALADLVRPGLRIVTADANVPVGRYTTQVIAKMSRSGLFGDDFPKRVGANVVSQESNVRSVLAKVSLDEADAGFVYSTDARTAADKILTIPIPDRMNVIAEYPIAVLTRSTAGPAAARFVELVIGARGREILARRGFEAP